MTGSARHWGGRIIKVFVVLFLLIDSTIHIANIPAVAAASRQLGYPVALMPAIGMVELLSLIVFVIPRTAVLGALLLTAYLGGATASQVRVDGSYAFSIATAILVWIATWLLDDRAFAAIVPFPAYREK